MSHHGSQDELLKRLTGNIPASEDFAKFMQDEIEKLELGPTGQFPDGKLADCDEGEIQIAVTVLQGKVVINFGKPIAFIGFTTEQADDIADLLRKHAADIRRFG